LRFVFSWTGAALAAAIITFPFQVRGIRLSLEAIDKGLHEAAQTLGAGALDRFVNITLPLALPGIVAGAITAFAASLGEFGAIITFVSNIPGETRTLPLAIYTALQTPGGEAEAARLAALSIALALVFMTIAEYAARRARANP
jgi:molybdate transport system permease protein